MRFVRIPVETINPETRERLVEDFVTRDGTDYGLEERILEEKKGIVLNQLERGEVVIVFDPESDTFNIIPKDELRSHTAESG